MTEVLETLLRKKDNFQPQIPWNGTAMGNMAYWSDALHCVLGDKLLARKVRLCLPTQISNRRSIKAFL